MWSDNNYSSILKMYLNKTGKLFEFSFSAPFILKGANKYQIALAKEYGLVFGLIFQIIDDVIDAWELCIYGNVDNEIFNVGTAKKTKFKDLINKIINLYDKNVKVEVTGSTPGDMMGCIADISKIETMLNYDPKYDLENGLKKFKDYLDSTEGN